MACVDKPQFRAKILVVDDNAANRDLLRQVLEPENFDVMLVPSGEIALDVAQRVSPDLILLDVVMPGGIDGFETCRRLKADTAKKDMPIIFITAQDETDSTVKGFEAGGVDYIAKPFAKEEVLVRVDTHLKNAMLTQQLIQKNEELQAEIERRTRAESNQAKAEAALQSADERLSFLSQQETERWGILGLVGRSQTLGTIVKDVRKVQDAGTTSVLIVGESGTGKELIARSIHFGGTRKDGPFIPVNCAAIPAELIESAFFGHKRGAFTGADTDHNGYFAMADGGTLFLDEIGDMPQDLQSKLLRVLEDGRFMPVGTTTEKQANVRVIAATNVHLETRMAQGQFREDLYYRLARFTIQLPPLRERAEDIPLLANHFLNLFAKEMGKALPVLQPDTLERLMSYAFPGNVRELKNIMEHALILSESGFILPEHLMLRTQVLQPSNQPSEMPLETHDHQAHLLVKRLNVDGAELESDEEKILEYLRQNTSINNAECREFLGVSRNRASYLLQKLQRYHLVVAEGQRRWLRYRLPS